MLALDTQSARALNQASAIKIGLGRKLGPSQFMPMANSLNASKGFGVLQPSLSQAPAPQSCLRTALSLKSAVPLSHEKSLNPVTFDSKVGRCLNRCEPMCV